MVGDALPSSWRWTTLGDVADPSGRAIVSGPFGSNIGSRFFVNEGVPVIRGNNLTTDMRPFIDSGFVFVTEEKAEELGNCDAVVDDLVFTAAGSLGQVGLIREDAKYPRYIISNKQMRARLDKRRVDPRFAFYWFASKEMVEYIQQRNTGSSVPLINLSVLRSLPLPLPPFDEQRAIVQVLGTLDDKIELIQRMNETLEAMARALFKSWFVDFDPVRAKAEGRDPALPKSIADLFPDSFEDSELGEIPKGLAIGKVADLCDAIYSGGTPSTRNPEYWGGDIPWLSSGETREKFIIDSEKRITQAGVSNSSTRPATACSTVIASAGQGNTRGQTSLLAIDTFVNQSVVVLTPNRETSSPYHLFFNLERRYEEFRRVSDGHSSRGSLTTKLLADLLAVLPPRDLVRAFDAVAAPLVGRAIGNLRESRTLATLRDTLLSKLISGELRVKDAERAVAAVA